MAVELELTHELEQLYTQVEQKHMAPLWTVTADLLTKEPASKAIPFIWHWDDYWPLLQRSGELVPVERGGERRVLAFINPGLPLETYGTTHTLWTAVQYLMPGEVAPAHRHSPGAIRFIIHGDRAFTTVNGDKCVMERGDLVLTPPWTWHDHGHEGHEPMVWMDGLDLPFMRGLEAVFFEPFKGNQQPQETENLSETKHRVGQLRPALVQPDPDGVSPLMNYKWEQTSDLLHSLPAGEASPFDDISVQFINPFNGGPVMPTLDCWIQLIRPGIHTRAHRQVTSKVYHVFEGSGCSIINGQRFNWKRGDFFCVPTWSWHEHVNDSGEEAILFSVQDGPIYKTLGIYREEAR